MSWDKVTTASRFVAFFDILGFKDMVMKSSHNDILEKLYKLKEEIKVLEEMDFNHDDFKDIEIKPKKDQTKSVTFSDSIIFFSRGDTKEDLVKILLDSFWILNEALGHGIAIKGAISFGEITVDFHNSLFFGQPIIDAYLLHEDLHMVEVVLDHNCENQINKIGDPIPITRNLRFDKVKMKYGATMHTLLVTKNIDERIAILNNLYKITSGSPRQYIDNSIEYYQKMKNESLEKNKNNYALISKKK